MNVFSITEHKMQGGSGQSSQVAWYPYFPIMGGPHLWCRGNFPASSLDSGAPLSSCANRQNPSSCGLTAKALFSNPSAHQKGLGCVTLQVTGPRPPLPRFCSPGLRMDLRMCIPDTFPGEVAVARAPQRPTALVTVRVTTDHIAWFNSCYQYPLQELGAWYPQEDHQEVTATAAHATP